MNAAAVTAPPTTYAVTSVPFDVEQARFNMIEQQIRPWDVLDQDVLDLLTVIRREEFVPQAYRALAFVDMEIPLGVDGAAMWAPRLEARVLQTLEVKSGERVLEIGTGSGYMAALLASRARIVTSVEQSAVLVDMAKANLKAAGVANVTVMKGDGAKGHSTDSKGQGSDKFDVIVLTGSVPLIADAFFNQLNVGGRLFAIVGQAPVMTARLYTKAANNEVSHEDLFETVVAPLAGAPAPSRFKF